MTDNFITAGKRYPYIQAQRSGCPAGAFRRQSRDHYSRQQDPRPEGRDTL